MLRASAAEALSCLHAQNRSMTSCFVWTCSNMATKKTPRLSSHLVTMTSILAPTYRILLWGKPLHIRLRRAIDLQGVIDDRQRGAFPENVQSQDFCIWVRKLLETAQLGWSTSRSRHLQSGVRSVLRSRLRLQQYMCSFWSLGFPKLSPSCVNKQKSSRERGLTCLQNGGARGICSVPWERKLRRIIYVLQKHKMNFH